MAQAAPMPDADDLADMIDDLGAAVANRYTAVEVEQIEAVADALRRGDIGDPVVQARLQAVAAAGARALVPTSLAPEVIAIASAAGLNIARRRIAAAGRTPGAGMPTAAAVENRALVFTLQADLSSMRGNIERWAPAAYRTASSMLTARDHQEAVAWRYLARGITGKTYSNGARMPIGSYAEMVVRTMSNQAAIIGGSLGQMQAGLALCQIAVGSDACSSCAANRGLVFSLDGRPAGVYSEQGVQVTVAGPLAQASAGRSHFRGPNCRCQVVAYFPGLPDPGSGWNPEGERQRDRQRAIERHIREWKAREAAALDDFQASESRRRVRMWQGEMRRFIGETGRVRNRYREQLTFATGPSMPSPPPPMPLV